MRTLLKTFSLAALCLSATRPSLAQDGTLPPASPAATAATPADEPPEFRRPAPPDLRAPETARTPAATEAAAPASNTARAAELTRQSLVLLEKAEDSDDEKVKMESYMAGEKLAREALALDDTNADTHFAVFATEGRRLVMEGSINPFSLLKVNEHLDRCLEINPDHSDALAARGGMYRQLPLLLGGDLEKAEADLKRSIELDPQATGARIELAKTYHDMGEDDKVGPLIEQALYWAEKLNKPRRIREAKAFQGQLKNGS